MNESISQSAVNQSLNQSIKIHTSISHRGISMTASTTMSEATEATSKEKSSISYPIDQMKGSSYIVTGASANHFDILSDSLLPSIEANQNDETNENPSTVFVYDLGFTPEQVETLRERFPDIKLRTFHFGNYPRHVNITVDNNYAWKPILINEVRKEILEFKRRKHQEDPEQLRFEDEDYTILLWLDAGDGVTRRLSKLYNYVLDNGGVFSPMSSGYVSNWTNPRMIFYMDTNYYAVANKQNCNAAIVAFDIQNQTVVDKILIPWEQCALTKDCIAPENSSKQNHRYDQAALTLIMLKNGIECTVRRGLFGLRTHVNEIAQKYQGMATTNKIPVVPQGHDYNDAFVDKKNMSTFNILYIVCMVLSTMLLVLMRRKMLFRKLNHRRR